MSSLSVCNTPACVAAAQAILSYMSPNYTAINPCTDWDTCKYSGNWSIYLKSKHILDMCAGFTTLYPPDYDEDGEDVLDDSVTNTLYSIMEGSYPANSTVSFASRWNFRGGDSNIHTESHGGSNFSGPKHLQYDEELL